MRRRRLLRFAGTFVPLFAAFVPVYLWIFPAYQAATAAGANAVLGAMTPPFRVTIDGRGDWVASRIAPGGLEPYYGMAARQRHLLYLNLALVPALLLATPVPWIRRLRMLAWATPLVFVCHVAVEVGLVRVHLCLDEHPGRFLCAWIREHLLVAGQVLAVIQWAAVSWSCWIPRSGHPQQARISGGVARNRPCPCGSGRKSKHCCAASR